MISTAISNSTEVRNKKMRKPIEHPWAPQMRITISAMNQHEVAVIQLLSPSNFDKALSEKLSINVQFELLNCVNQSVNRQTNVFIQNTIFFYLVYF